MSQPSGGRTDERLRAATRALADRPETSPRLEAELLLTQATGWTRSALIAWPERELSPTDASRFEALLGRRLTGEPIAYIRGRQDFWTLELKVSPATLIPRPETERLVETALERLAHLASPRVADLGTGSGAIAAALASERPDWDLIATDSSAAALAVARENLAALGLGRARVLQASWLAAFAPASLDAAVTNPPYIPADDPHLGRGDLRFEPRTALTPEGDGFAAIHAILRDAHRCLRPGGLLILEHGFDQSRAVQQLFAEHGLTGIEAGKDLAGLDRFVLGHR